MIDPASARRHSRQISLPDIGPEGQERIASAEVALVGDDLAIETAQLYLAAAGASRFRRIGRTAEDWEASLQGASVVLRSGFDDDSMLRAAVKLGIPAVVMRSHPRIVDVLAFRKHGPCPHAALNVPARDAGGPPSEGVQAVIAGTLAATEVLWILARPGEAPRARHLRVPLNADRHEDPLSQEIPWSPECVLCGGTAPPAVIDELGE